MGSLSKISRKRELEQHATITGELDMRAIVRIFGRLDSFGDADHCATNLAMASPLAAARAAIGFIFAISFAAAE